MSDQELMKLKWERAQLRRVFSTIHEQIMEMAEGENILKNEFEEKYAKAEDKVQRLFKIDEQVCEILFLINSDEIDLNKEFDQIEEYREKWLKIICVHRRIFKEPSQEVKKDSDLNVYSSREVTSVRDCTRKHRLPKVDLPKFDGELKNWIGFWAEFKKIHENNELDDEDKFYYLLQSTKEGSPAREIVNSLSPLAENYSKAVEELKVRFGNDDLMKRLYVRELLKLVLSQNTSVKPLSLSELYVKLETQLESLKSLGVTNEEFDCLLFPLVESALPENILREWERRRAIINDTMTDKLEDLLRFLKNEIECEERVNLARSTFTECELLNKRALQFCNDKSKNSHRPNKNVSSMENDMINLRSKLMKNVCLFCGAQHGHESCRKAIGMSAEKISTIIRNKRACYKCLKIGHQVRYCRTKVVCLVCSGGHNTLMCKNRVRKLEEKKKEDTEVIVHNLTDTHINTVQLQTLVVSIKGKMERKVRAFIDTTSERSYVTRKLVNMMGYEPENDVKQVYAIYESSDTDSSQHRSYQVRLSNVNNSYSCNFIALDTEVIRKDVTLAAAGPWVRELERQGIVLTESDEGSIDILIGADIAGKLLSGRRTVLNSGLVAIETFLGWTVMGQMRDESSSCVSYMSSTEVEVSERSMMFADSNNQNCNEIIQYSNWWENPSWFKVIRMSGILTIKLLQMGGFLPSWSWKKSSRSRKETSKRKEIESS